MASTSSPLSFYTLGGSAPHAVGNHAPAIRVHLRRQVGVSASCTAAAERTASTASRHGSLAFGSLYEVLGIQVGATCQEVKAAYRRLARVLHPDVASDCSGHEFMRVHEAYATLSDPQKRADYDGSLTSRRRRVRQPFSSSSVSATVRSSEFSRRRWESDQCW